MDWAQLLKIVQLLEMVLRQLVSMQSRGAAARSTQPVPNQERLVQDLAAYLQSLGAGTAREADVSGDR